MILRGYVFSQVLEAETGITVVTPNRILKEGDYRVAYLLHGLCGSSTTWADCSMLPAFAGEGKTVYVLPDAARSFYTDMEHGSAYFTYLTEELPALCRSFFHISSRREDTAVLGCSMGGYGALKCALSRPEQYGMCAAFSSACLFLREGLEMQRKKENAPELTRRYGAKLLSDFVSIFGQELNWRPEDEILALARRAADAQKLPKLLLTCGTRDPFRQDHLRFVLEWNSFAPAVAYEEWEGGHDFAFFNQSLERAVERFGL